MVGGEQFAQGVQRRLRALTIRGEGHIVPVFDTERDHAEDARRVHRSPGILGDRDRDAGVLRGLGEQLRGPGVQAVPMRTVRVISDMVPSLELAIR